MSLRSEDLSTRATAFEDAVLAAMSLRPADVDVEACASAYAKLSARLNEPLDGPSAHQVRTEAEALVFGLVYAARTFHAAHRILAAYPPPPERLVELGAGWGPFGLAASLRFPELKVQLVDADAAALERAQRLFEVCERAAPRIEVANAEAKPTGRVDAIALPFSFCEVGAPVETWTRRLNKGGRLYILEAGSQRAARSLQNTRDGLGHGFNAIAPCTGAPVCPMTAKDWCHFTWKSSLGTLGQAIAEGARRRWREQHLSFLVIQRTRVSRGLRVLDVRPHGKSKVVARCCGPDGLINITAIRRVGAAFDRVSQLTSGAVVNVVEGAVKGDGVRIDQAEGLELLHDL